MSDIKELPSAVNLWKSYLVKYRITPRPRVACIEVSYKCNSRCVFCERWSKSKTDKRKELSESEIMQLIDDLKRIGIKHVNFSGGEPLLRKDTLAIARYAKKRNMKTMVNTNGLLINENNIQEIVDSFDRITVSIDTLKPKQYMKLRGVDGLKIALHAVDLLAQHGKGRVKMVVNSKNYKELYDYADYFIERGVEISFQPIHSEERNLLKLGDSKLAHFKDGQEYAYFLNMWHHFITKYDLKEEYYKYFPEFLQSPLHLYKTFICFAGSFDLFIDPYGNVFPCESRRDMILGNIRKTGLAQIWKNAYATRKWISGPDRDCICWWSCSAKRYIKLSKPLRIK